jgi:hypothetical protein
MLAVPTRGVVFLAMTKSASTAIESAFRDHAELLFTGPPRFKHINYSIFNLRVAPLLAARGHPRSSYEVICAFREPMEWLNSWWRYRSRSDPADTPLLESEHFTGDETFDEFVRGYIAQSPRHVNVGRPSVFVRNGQGHIGVDRIYRYDDVDDLVSYIAARLGRDIRLSRVNPSPERRATLSAAVEAAARTHLAPEYHIYENLTVRDGRSPLLEDESTRILGVA